MVILGYRSLFGIGQLEGGIAEAGLIKSGQSITCLELILILDEGIVFGCQTNVPASAHRYLSPGYLMNTSVRASAVIVWSSPWQKRIWLGALLI
jgi:hypothetical protein